MVNQLAQLLNVTENDAKSLLTLVMNALEKDKMIEYYVNASQEAQAEIIQAYTAAEVKRFNEFCVSLLTDDRKKTAVALYCLERLNQD